MFFIHREREQMDSGASALPVPLGIKGSESLNAVLSNCRTVVIVAAIHFGRPLQRL